MVSVVQRTDKAEPKKDKGPYKHMSCVIGQADGEIAKVVELIQQVLGVMDSQFLRGIVYKFLIDSGYATTSEKDIARAKKTGGLILGDVAVNFDKVKTLKKKVERMAI